MKEIKIGFTDFWGNFNPEDNFITQVLRSKYRCVLSENPDYLFFSTFGCSHLKYDCVKIMFIGENLTPDFNLCDYALGFDWLEFGDRYMRLPLYLVRDNFKDFIPNSTITDEVALNRKFCSIVVSNTKNANPMRERFFRLLSEYKQVDSGGRLWNNIGGSIADKDHFISQYKFNIAFENSRSYGYTTEKIIDAMIADTLPIYWGNPLVHRDFNPKSFINISDYQTAEKAVERIMELDNNDDLYLQMLRESKVADLSMFGWEKRLIGFLSQIVEKPLDSAKYTTDYGMQKLHKHDLKMADFFGNKMRLNKAIAAYQLIRSRLK